MRVTVGHNFRARFESIRHQARESLSAQRTASTGLAIERPSDDPAGVHRATLMRGTYADVTTGRNKMARAIDELMVADEAMDSMGYALSRIRELAVQMANETMSATDRAGAAEEVTRLREALISLGNTRAGEKRLFGGQQTGASPFDAAGVYTGDANAQEVILEGNTVVEVTIAGDELLRGAAGGPDILLEVENLANGLSTNTTLDIQNGIAALDDSISHLLEFRAEVGARMNLTVQLDRHFETVETGLVADISGLEEADPIEAFSELMRTNTAYETVMQVAVNSRTRNIFELL